MVPGSRAIDQPGLDVDVLDDSAVEDNGEDDGYDNMDDNDYADAAD